MLGRKIAVCLALFAALLAGGWLGDRSVQTQRENSVSVKRPAEEGSAVVRSAPSAPFRSREYVKVVRSPEILPTE